MNISDTDKINADLEVQLKKAFYDLIVEKTDSDTPDFDWLIKLYSEIRDGLMCFLKKGSSLRTEIEDCLDIEIFTQLITNSAFRGEDMVKLINYTFNKLLELGSPGRDVDYQKRREEALVCVYSEDVTFGKIVATYLQNAHISIGELHSDLANIKNTLTGVLIPKTG